MVLRILLLLIIFLSGQPLLGIENKECFDCHGNKDILKMSEEERDAMVVTPKQKHKPRERKYNLYIAEGTFNRSSHSTLYCTDCHISIRDIPHNKWTEPVSCQRCHPATTKQYALSNHYKISNAKCYDCHNPHESRTYRELSVKERSNICLGCHKKGGHQWLPERELHFSSLECSICHSPSAEKEMVLFISPSKNRRPLTYDEIKKALPGLKGSIENILDTHSNKNIDTEEIKAFLSNLEKGGIKSPRLAGDGLVTKTSHDFTRIIPEARDCTMCHKPFVYFYSKVSMKIPTKEGWKTFSADKEIINKLPVIPAKDAYFGTVHRKNGVECIECHAYQSVIREAEKFKLKEMKELVCGTRCHKEIMDEYKGSIHYKVHENFCLDCHEPHPSVPYVRLNTEQRRAICIKCHKETEKQHRWQAQQTLHCRYVECTMCHSPKAKKGIVLYLRGIDHKGSERQLESNDILELIGSKHRDLQKVIDRDGNKILDEHEVAYFIKLLNRPEILKRKGLDRVEMGINLSVIRPYHNFTEKLSKAKDCSLCHSASGEGLESLVLQIPDTDKKSLTIPIEKDAIVAFLAMPGLSNFYLLGGKKITKQDILLFWEKEPREALINLGFKMIDILGMFFLASAFLFVGIHGTIRILTRPMRKNKKD
ncbi:MAG: hypothetical protein N2745_02365 [Syntrophorhabdaceae bacterium]|nr:hypothetical protein [Syntrophorhabdaceae bacterium]